MSLLDRHLRPMRVLLLCVLVAALAACGSDAQPSADDAVDDAATDDGAADDATGEDGAATADDGGTEDPICDEYPTEDIEFIVPYSAGGGFDTWARLIAPHLQDELGVNVQVVNREGGGGLVGVTEVYGSQPDGTRLAITDPADHAIATISGQTDTPLQDLRVVSRITVAPELIAVSADSEWDSIEDVQAEERPIVKGAGGLSASNIVSFDALDLEFEHVLHEGSSESILSVIRGDTEIALFPVSSLAEYVRAGDMKPLVVVGNQVPDNHPDADVLEGVPTLDEVTGQDGLGSSLEQHRVIVTAPETPDCVMDTLDAALESVFEDEEFQQEVEEAGFLSDYRGWQEAEEIRDGLFDVISEYEDLLAEVFDQ